MTRSILLFLTMLAATLTPVAARAQLPRFVQQGLVVSYVQLGTDEKFTSNGPQATYTNFSQTFFVADVDVNSDEVAGTIVISNPSSAPSWTCYILEPGCAPNNLPFNRFWVDPTNPTVSIGSPNAATYLPGSTCNGMINQVACTNFQKACSASGTACMSAIFQSTNISATPNSMALLAFDTSSGLVTFFNYSISPNNTSVNFPHTSTYTLVPPQRRAIRDFNGDGKADILWRTGTGDFYLWKSTPGSSVVSFTGQDLGVPPSDWHIQDVADFNADGKGDILWRTDDGHLYLWNSTPDPKVPFTFQDLGVPPSDWSIQAVADFNGDTKADILWRTGTGDLYLWNSTPGPAVSFTGQDLGVPPSDWHIQDVADFNRDGKADILWRTDDGHVYLWNSSPGSAVSFTSQDLGIPPSGWYIQYVADFNGDGKADILWRTDDGHLYLWNSTPGSAVSFIGQDLGVPPSDWAPVPVGTL